MTAIHFPKVTPLTIDLASTGAKQYDQDNLSGTNRKTYCLVILGNLLIGASFLLGCSSFFLATLVNPALIAIIIPSVALGMIGIYLTPQLSACGHSVKHQEFIKGQPLGLRNEDGVNCWINAGFQVVAHTILAQKIKEAVVHRPAIFTRLVKALDAYESVRQNNSSVETPQYWIPKEVYNTQKLRKWLTRSMNGKIKNPDLQPITSGDALKQEEAISLFRHLAHTLPFPFDLEQVTTRCSTDRNAPLPEEPYSVRSPDFAYFDFKHLHNETFEQLRYNFFNNQSEYTHENYLYKIHMQRCFRAPPEFFMLSIDRAKGSFHNTRKEMSRVDVPRIWTLRKQESPSEQPSYQCTGFVLHLGRGANSGHYVAYVQSVGKYWLLNDARYPRVVSEMEYKSAMEMGSIFIYEKIIAPS